MDFINNAYNMIAEKIGNWLNSMITMLPNFIVAVIVVLLFYAVSRLIVAFLSKTVFRFSHNIAVNKLIASITKMTIMTVGLFVALGILDLDKTVTSLLAGVGIMGLAIGFAFKDAIANFLSGIYITLKSTVNVGDIIQFGGNHGTVKSIGLRAIKKIEYLQALHDGIKNIKKTYDENGITIPFPIRTLDFGIKGGKTLSEMTVNMRDAQKRTRR